MIRFLLFNVAFFSIIAFFSACSSSFLKLEKKEEDFVKNVEFDEKVVIKELPPEVANSNNQVVEIPVSIISQSTEKPVEPKSKSVIKNKAAKNKKTKKSETTNPQTEIKPLPSDPASIATEMEDKDGINGRRPVKDPFRVGEEVVHELHYFKVAAGELTLKVGPFVEVNGKRSYTFTTEIESSSMFSSFYSVKDIATTYVDFMEFVPHVFTLAVKETGQIKDAKGLFDIANNKATYWEKKFTKKAGHEESKKEWDILPFSQNVYSAAFYMRLFKWEVGKEYAFRVADQGENIVFRGKAIRKERIETEVGDFDTIVIKPEITVKGIFKPIGDIYFWLSDDDRKFILRIESSIKIGTIISEVTKLKPGN